MVVHGIQTDILLVRNLVRGSVWLGVDEEHVNVLSGSQDVVDTGAT